MITDVFDNAKLMRENKLLRRKLDDAILARQRAMEGWMRAVLDRDDSDDKLRRAEQEIIDLESQLADAHGDSSEWELRSKAAWQKLHSAGIYMAEVPDD